MSLYTVVSRGVAGRFGQRASDSRQSGDRGASHIPDVRLSGASMRILEAGLAFTAIATAILIGVGR